MDEVDENSIDYFFTMKLKVRNMLRYWPNHHTYLNLSRKHGEVVHLRKVHY